ncbi:MAG: ribbon-helix-helix domain-containing protein [Asticcacaulis sp.]
MSKPANRPSLADRLAAVAGPQIPTSAQAVKEATPKPQAVRPKAANLSETPTETPAQPISTTTKARIGKTMIAGYFTPQMARAVKMLAVERDTTVQALIGEGLDAVLHKYGKHPMGER